MSYKSLQYKSAVQAQKYRLETLVSLGATGTDRDGLTMVPASGAEPPEHLDKFELRPPAALVNWLRDLSLLRHLPLAYLLPDPRLLPPEAIRFFHVDRAWVDRLVDGALSAAVLGTLEVSYRIHTLVALRAIIDGAIDQIVSTDEDDPYLKGWTASDRSAPITGMLIRSEAVRRWPQLIVEGFEQAKRDQEPQVRVRLLRKDRLAKDLMIVLFAGEPRRVELREPDVALRYGVEEEGSTWQVNLRLENGDPGPKDYIEVPRRSPGSRTLNVHGLEAEIGNTWGDTSVGSRGVALNLEQRPYVQVFSGSDEGEGHRFPPRRLKAEAVETLERHVSLGAVVQKGGE